MMIGSPLTHVRSPAIINAMLRETGEKVEVVAQEVRTEQLGPFVNASRGAHGITGLIVTTPLKNAICSHLDRRTAIVELIGASNCVRCEGAHWFGANFDGYGFAAAIGMTTLSGRRVLLVGCRGAGSAIAASLAAVTEIELSVFDLDFARTETLASRLRRFAPNARIKAIEEPAGKFEIVVNASTSGMQEDDLSPVPTDIVAGASLIADIIVDRDTRLKQDARRYHKPLIDGEAMVRGQARFLQRFILGKAESEEDAIVD